MNNYKFTETWFDIAIPAWTKLFEVYPMPKDILEVGCYEGRATTWLCDNVIKGEKVNYDIVDTFEGSLEEAGMIGTKERLGGGSFIEQNFMHNISFHKNVDFKIHKGYSQQILPNFPQEERYDFIYIDASHRADDTFVDAYYCHKMLKVGGVVVFDDFAWKDPKNLHIANSPEFGIKVFCTMYDKHYDVLFDGYQIALLKK
jgi:predicted O-methyltransferase YrrM